MSAHRSQIATRNTLHALVAFGLTVCLAAHGQHLSAQESTQPMTNQTITLPDWKDYAEQLERAGDEALALQPKANGPMERQEAAQAFIEAIAAAYLMRVYSDPDYPEFLPMWNTAFNVLGPVPDTAYSFTRINGAGTYRIRGFRNTVRYVELTLNSGNLEDGSMRPVNPVDLDTLRLNADTSFELILSPERPRDYVGNWIETGPEITSLLVRSQSYDWLNEKDGVMAIERLDVPVRRPRPTAQHAAERMSALAGYAKEIQASSYLRVQASFDKNLVHKLEGREYGGSDYVKVYLEGLYEIADDEVVIIETDIPDICRYWSIILLDTNKGSIDWINHQSSINGHQAHIDSDGKFRAVISLKDPGVPNWLDPAELALGVIQVRWDMCNSAPSPQLRKVKLDQLRKLLPLDTPVITATERDANLRQRRYAAQMRRKW